MRGACARWCRSSFRVACVVRVGSCPAAAPVPSGRVTFADPKTVCVHACVPCRLGTSQVGTRAGARPRMRCSPPPRQHQQAQRRPAWATTCSSQRSLLSFLAWTGLSSRHTSKRASSTKPGRQPRQAGPPQRSTVPRRRRTSTTPSGGCVCEMACAPGAGARVPARAWGRVCMPRGRMCVWARVGD